MYITKQKHIHRQGEQTGSIRGERGAGRSRQGWETETRTTVYKADVQQGRRHSAGRLYDNAKWT